jgi:hypothetical protein
MKYPFYRIPAGVNIPSLLEIAGYSELCKPLLLDKLHSIVDLLYSRRLNYNEEKRNEFISLHSQILAKNYTCQRYTLYLEALIAIGIVECDNVWRRKDRAKGFRIAPSLCEAEFEKVSVFDLKLHQKVTQHREAESKKLIANHAGVAQIARSLENVKFDYESALSFIESPGNKYSPEGLQYRKAVCDRLLYDPIYIIRDDQGRLYHNFTLLPRDLRQFVRWGDNLDHLFISDIGSSQPCFLMKFARDENFIEQLEKNEHYSLTNSKLRKPYDFNDPKQKDSFKKKYCSGFLFCDRNREGKVGEVIWKQFPEVFEAVRALKSRKASDLSTLLQKTESEVVIDGAGIEFATRFPSACLISLHDGLITTESHLEPLYEIMKRHTSIALNFNVPVKTSKFSTAAS